MRLPMVEIFETVEGEGVKAGFPTTFVRVFNCNLRCTWCDSTYSYAPSKPEFMASIEEIVIKVKQLGNVHVCLTGGEPLMHGDKSLELMKQLAELDFIEDIHIETNGAISLKAFANLRRENQLVGDRVRFIMDYKLPASGEMEQMIEGNFHYLEDPDEVKFVIQDRVDYETAVQAYQHLYLKGTVLFSPVWGKLAPETLVNWILADKLKRVKLSLQTHKYIWDPETRGV
jgi:7-carboxy-7-deazaguanine synthase